MPHACIATRQATNVRAATPAPPPDGLTHICEKTDSNKAFCGEKVGRVDPPEIAFCDPSTFGDPCTNCGDACHKKHGKIPRYHP
jgi:hypothetical protein